MAYTDPEGAGVGGWLALFVIIIAVISPLVAVATTAGNLYGDAQVAAFFGESWTLVQAFEWLITAIVVGCCWYIAWRLNYVQVWTTVRITIAGIWIIAIGAPFVEVAGLALISGLPFSTYMEGIQADLARPLIFCGVWTAYFLMSKRVANTYSRNPQADEAAEIFR